MNDFVKIIYGPGKSVEGFLRKAPTTLAKSPAADGFEDISRCTGEVIFKKDSKISFGPKNMERVLLFAESQKEKRKERKKKGSSSVESVSGK